MNKEDLKEKNIINNNVKKEEKNLIQNKNEIFKEKTPLKNDTQNQETEKSIINSMKLEIERLKDNLSECQKNINNLVQENNKFKLLQIENSKQLSVKENIINSNKIEINRLQTKNSSLESENNEKKKIIQELNYKIIELNQKIESNESINKITQKIKNNGEENDDKYLLEINELYNKINEIEIKNSKLDFDNKNLLIKIEMQKSDKKNEIEIIEMLHKKKVENLEKNINNLNSTINELINENNKQPKEFNYFQIQNDIYKSFSEYDQKIRKYDEENFQLKKENQKLKNENEELKIIINGKENIIDKLQSNISKIENEFKAKLIELNSKYDLSVNQNNNIDKNENEINNNNNLNNNENLEKMMEDQRRLIEENTMLKGNYEQMMQGIDEANALFLNKQNEYENIINAQNEKLKEYKYKISLLKIKINELHSEIGFLQEKEIKNQNNFFQPMNENLLSNVDKERQSIDFNFTPDQIKFANNYGSASGSPDNNQNENANY